MYSLTKAKTLFVLLLLFSLVIGVSAEDSMPTEGLTLYLPFSEGSGTTTHDVSGNENHGTITGASWNATGQVGYALSFDGTDYVNVSNAESLNLTMFTLMCWVNHVDNSSDQQYMRKGNNYLIGLIGDHFEVAFHNGSQWQVCFSTTSPSVGTWYFVAGVFDGTYLKIYVDGVNEKTETKPYTPTMNGDNLFIGSSDATTRNMTGVIDEGRVYNRDLTAKEIAVLAGISYTPEAPALTTVNVQWTWQYLYAGDFIGFFNAVLLTAFLSQTLAFAVISLIGFSALYLRTKSLMLLAILWILLGGFFIAAMPEVALLAIVFLVLGIGSLLYRLFRPSSS